LKEFARERTRKGAKKEEELIFRFLFSFDSRAFAGKFLKPFQFKI